MGNRKDYHENEPATQGQEKARDSKNDHHDHQKGPQVHAEGQHGSKTHARLVEQLHEGEREEAVEDRVERKREEGAYAGARRLVEDREQHDEAEKNSEKNRLMIERERGRDVGPADSDKHLKGTSNTGQGEGRADNKPKGPQMEP